MEIEISELLARTRLPGQEFLQQQVDRFSHRGGGDLTIVFNGVITKEIILTVPHNVKLKIER